MVWGCESVGFAGQAVLESRQFQPTSTARTTCAELGWLCRRRGRHALPSFRTSSVLRVSALGSTAERHHQGLLPVGARTAAKPFTPTRGRGRNVVAGDQPRDGPIASAGVVAGSILAAWVVLKDSLATHMYVGRIVEVTSFPSAIPPLRPTPGTVSRRTMARSCRGLVVGQLPPLFDRPPRS